MSRAGADEIPRSEKHMFGSKALRCLVCKALLDELEYAISTANPAKKIEKGSFRLTTDGAVERKLVSDALAWKRFNSKTAIIKLLTLAGALR